MCLALVRCLFTFSEILFSLGFLNAPIKWPDFFLKWICVKLNHKNLSFSSSSKGSEPYSEFKTSNHFFGNRDFSHITYDQSPPDQLGYKPPLSILYIKISLKAVLTNNFSKVFMCHLKVICDRNMILNQKRHSMLIQVACPRTIPKHFQLKVSKMLTAKRRWQVGQLLLMAF